MNSNLFVPSIPIHDFSSVCIRSTWSEWPFNSSLIEHPKSSPRHGWIDCEATQITSRRFYEHQKYPHKTQGFFRGYSSYFYTVRKKIQRCLHSEKRWPTTDKRLARRTQSPHRNRKKIERWFHGQKYFLHRFFYCPIAECKNTENQSEYMDILCSVVMQTVNRLHEGMQLEKHSI